MIRHTLLILVLTLVFFLNTTKAQDADTTRLVRWGYVVSLLEEKPSSSLNFWLQNKDKLVTPLDFSLLEEDEVNSAFRGINYFHGHIVTNRYGHQKLQVWHVSPCVETHGELTQEKGKWRFDDYSQVWPSSRVPVKISESIEKIRKKLPSRFVKIVYCKETKEVLSIEGVSSYYRVYTVGRLEYDEESKICHLRTDYEDYELIFTNPVQLELAKTLRDSSVKILGFERMTQSWDCAWKNQTYSKFNILRGLGGDECSTFSPIENVLMVEKLASSHTIEGELRYENCEYVLVTSNRDRIDLDLSSYFITELVDYFGTFEKGMANFRDKTVIIKGTWGFNYRNLEGFPDETESPKPGTWFRVYDLVKNR